MIASRSQIAGTLPDGLPADTAAAASDSIDGALISAAELPGLIGESLVAAAQAAFTSGLNAAALASAIIAASRLSHIPPARKAQHADEQAEADAR